VDRVLVLECVGDIETNTLSAARNLASACVVGENDERSNVKINASRIMVLIGSLV